METLCPNGQCLLGVFDGRLQAERAVAALESAGFDHRSVGMALRGSDVVAGGMATDAVGTKDGEGAIKGAAIGAVVGGTLAGLAALVVPGVGPVLALGTLYTALGGAAAGAATGGLLGAMSGLGLSEEEAVYYERYFHEGKALVAVRDPAGRTREAADILESCGAYDVTKRPVPAAQQAAPPAPPLHPPL